MICVVIYVGLAVYAILHKKKKLPAYCYGKVARQMFLCLTAANTLALVLFLLDQKESKVAETILRNGYGKGKKAQELEMTIPGKLDKEPIQIEIQERAYTEKEIKKLFEKAIKELDSIILGANKSKDHVEENLNLVRTVPGTLIEIDWSLDHYEVLNIYGELQSEGLVEAGTLVEIRGILHYGKEEAMYVTNVMVYPPTKSGKEKIVQDVQQMVEEEDARAKGEKTVQLPKQWNEKQIHWSKKQESRGYIILLLGVCGTVFIGLLQQQNKRKEKQEKRRQMLLDYPEIVNKLVLLLGAGMTVKNAWIKIVSDYREQKESMGTRHAYEEMDYTLHEMQGGITEVEGYERFGKRCILQPYLKLGALLSQNVRKGTKGLTELLGIEAFQAFEERKNRARRLGEEASTKLLLPMFFMLAVVLIIVIVPAFLSVQL